VGKKSGGEKIAVSFVWDVGSRINKSIFFPFVYLSAYGFSGLLEECRYVGSVGRFIYPEACVTCHK
jgi:hypothetical protein